MKAGEDKVHTSFDCKARCFYENVIKDNEKIEALNEVKEENNQDLIDITYYVYPGADHNMVPNWNEVIQKDLRFFSTEFKKLDL